MRAFVPLGTDIVVGGEVWTVEGVMRLDGERHYLLRGVDGSVARWDADTVESARRAAPVEPQTESPE